MGFELPSIPYWRELMLALVTLGVYTVIVFSDRASYARLERDLDRLRQLGAAKAAGGVSNLERTTAYISAFNAIDDLVTNGPIHRRSEDNYVLMVLLGVIAAGLVGLFTYAIHKAVYLCPRYFLGGLSIFPYDCPTNVNADVFHLSADDRVPSSMRQMIKYQVGTLYAVGTALFMSLYTMMRQIYLLVQQYRFDGMTALRYILYLFSSIGLAVIFWMVAGAVFDSVDSIANTIALPVVIGMVAALIPDEIVQGVLHWMRRKGAILSPKALNTNEELPKALPLTLVHGITEAIGDTLRNSGIQDCHQLAVANPLYLYCVSPFTLSQVIDWMSQAQLVVILQPDKAAKLRNAGFPHAFGFMGDAVASGPTVATQPTMATLLDMTIDQVTLVQSQMAGWQPYRQLKEVCDAL